MLNWRELKKCCFSISVFLRNEIYRNTPNNLKCDYKYRMKRIMFTKLSRLFR